MTVSQPVRSGQCKLETMHNKWEVTKRATLKIRKNLKSRADPELFPSLKLSKSMMALLINKGIQGEVKHPEP